MPVKKTIMYMWDDIRRSGYHIIVLSGFKEVILCNIVLPLMRFAQCNRFLNVHVVAALNKSANTWILVWVSGTSHHCILWTLGRCYI